MKTVFNLLLALVLLTNLVLAENPKMTNEDVVKLVKAGLFRITANHYLVLLPNRELALWSPQDGLGTPLTPAN